MDPDLLQVLPGRVAREEIARSGKTKARGVAGLHLGLPCPGVAQDPVFEAALGLVECLLEVGCGARLPRHAPQRSLIGFSPRAQGLLPQPYY